MTFSHEQVSEVVKSYGLAGIQHWDKSIPEGTRKRIRALGIYPEVQTVQLERWFAKVSRSGSSGTPIFIPTPKPQDDNCKIAFFVPEWKDKKLKITLLVWLDIGESSGETIAFRIEQADEKSSHSYPHLQLTRAVRSPSHDTTLGRINKWVPDSYPAFPTRCLRNIDPFLCMLAALHGYGKEEPARYALQVIRDALSGNMARRVQAVGDALAKYALG
jgi:hypothetical protein